MGKKRLNCYHYYDLFFSLHGKTFIAITPKLKIFHKSFTYNKIGCAFECVQHTKNDD